ncbi:glycosyltransferase 87 family protein [Catenulispora pinisilvae]|uniref:glycosyltransferase 87 family protein n=1 Tax=Catenulispora pinisilvae TaxID=2705253 RepID=UPI001891331D|nr:glycosyltransferase 87 family protein [Catenulispora pinisilvae]
MARLPDRRRLTLLLGVFAGVALAAYLVIRTLAHPTMIDMVVYRAEGSAVLHGQDLYSPAVGVNTAGGNQLPATYPPFAAMLFAAISWIPVGVLKVLVTAANIVLLATVVHLAAKLIGGWLDRPTFAERWALIAAVTGLALWFEPVWTTLRYGQINLALCALILFDLTRPPTSKWPRGLGIGLATGIKLTPGVFILWFLLAGRRRETIVSAASALGTMAVGFAVLPHASVKFWLHEMWDTSKVGKTYITDNQSLSGMIARVTHIDDPKALWAVAAVIVLAVGLWAAVRNSRRGDDTLGALACAVTGLLISPISWSHHWVWAVPVAMLLAVRAPKLAVAWSAVFLSFLIWAVPHKTVGPSPDLNPLQMLLSSLYPLAGLAFLLWAWRESTRAQPVSAS